MGRKKDTGSLASIPISRHGGRVEVNGKKGDLTPVLLLAADKITVVDPVPEIAASTHGLLTDLAHPPALIEESFFALCGRRIREFVARRSLDRRKTDADEAPG